jgi:hypothetical protein
VRAYDGRKAGENSTAQGSGRSPRPVGGHGGDILALQRTIGNRAVVQMLRQQDEERRAAQQDQADVQRSAVHDVLRSSGRPLDEETRADMEGRLGADFSDVRIHDDTAAKASAAEIGARAYTSGSHVVIGEGSADKHTLAHELTHVIQQRQGPVAGTDNGNGLSVSDPSDRYEREAEALASRAMRGNVAVRDNGKLPTADLASNNISADGTQVQRVAAGGGSIKKAGEAIKFGHGGQAGEASGSGVKAKGKKGRAKGKGVEEGGGPAAEPKAGATGADAIGFVGVVPVRPDESDILESLIDRYSEDAFDQDVKMGIGARMGLVIGVNSEVGAWKKTYGKIYQSALKKLDPKKIKFPVTIVPFNWEGGGEKPPYGEIRNRIVNGDETKEMAELLKRGGMSRVYIHLGDADVHSLRIGQTDHNDGGKKWIVNNTEKGASDDEAEVTGRPGLFAAAADALHEEEYPDVLSGGYRAPADAPLMVKLAVEADMETRQGLSRRAVAIDKDGNRKVRTRDAEFNKDDIKINAPAREFERKPDEKEDDDHSDKDLKTLGRGPYLPEPNTFVLYSEDRGPLEFGSKDKETRKMVSNLEDPRVVFDKRLAIATDMTRLGKPVLESKGEVESALGALRDIYNKTNVEGEENESGERYIARKLEALAREGEAQAHLEKLRKVLKSVRQTHANASTGNFLASLGDISKSPENEDRREAEQSGKVASDVEVEHAVSVILRKAIEKWDSGGGFDPYEVAK